MFHFCKWHISIAGLLLLSQIFTSSANSATLQNGNGTIPYHFKDGEVISADVMNDVFERIQEVVEGFSSPEAMVGVWSCTTYTAEASCGVTGFLPTPKGILKSKAQDVTFACDATNCTWTAAEFWPGSCLSDFSYGRNLTQKYDITGDFLISLPPKESTWQPNGQVHSYKRLGPNVFTWYITGSLPVTTFARCERQLLPPAIPSDLAVSVANATVSLTWGDDSSNETAFVILRKLGNSGNWTEIGTVPSNTTTFSESLPSGDYSYRVLSRNGNGDSLGSNIAVVVIP